MTAMGCYPYSRGGQQVCSNAARQNPSLRAVGVTGAGAGRVASVVAGAGPVHQPENRQSDQGAEDHAHPRKKTDLLLMAG